MRIQYISLTKKNYQRFTCSTFKEYQTIDTFDATVIDLSSQDVWKTRAGVPDSVDCENTLFKLGNIVKNSKKKNILILLPININYVYSDSFYSDYYNKAKEMCDCLESLKNTLIRTSFLSKNTYIECEHNTTILKDGTNIDSDFYFAKHRDSGHLIPKTVSFKSDKMTSIYDEFINLYYTFLDISNEDLLTKLLLELGIDSESDNIPSWLEEMNVFDDESLKNEILGCNNQIGQLKETIEFNKNKIKNNNYYKEMLIYSGDELVERVFKTLEELLGIDLQQFVDKKGPDFVFKLNDCVYVGEIKGISTNVKNANISQIDVHESNYIDALEERGESIPKIKKLLIINHQRNKPFAEREPINDNQVRLAKNHGVLIVETASLIKLLEEFRKRGFDKETIINLLHESKGRLVV